MYSAVTLVLYLFFPVKSNQVISLISIRHQSFTALLGDSPSPSIRIRPEFQSDESPDAGLEVFFSRCSALITSSRYRDISKPAGPEQAGSD